MGGSTRIVRIKSLRLISPVLGSSETGRGGIFILEGREEEKTSLSERKEGEKNGVIYI